MKRSDEKLIADYLAGEDVASQLEKAIKIRPELALKLAEQQCMHRRLKHSFNAQSSEEFLQEFERKLDGASDLSVIPSKSKKVWYFAVAFACLVLLSSFLLPFGGEDLGLVERSIAATSEGKPILEGERLKPGPFVLSQGFAELQLSSGVRLLVEAPSQLELLSQEHVLLHHGNLVANVPPQAVGFKVDTPSSYIVDLGTEFGVSVEKDGRSQVHVIKGEVKVRASLEHNYEHLVKDQARAFDLQKQVAIIESQPHRYMRALPGKSAQAPDYLHWSFDEVNETQSFICVGPGIDGACYDARIQLLDDQISPPDLIMGKFSFAAYFDGENNWLNTEYRGVGGNKPRTVAFWIKAPTDFSEEQGFGILSWGLSDKRSAWQISLNPLDVSGPIGRLRIGTNQGEIVGTTDLRDERWHHIAIVLFGGDDADLSTHVLMYVDGLLENSLGKSIARVYTELNHPDSKPLTMGRNIAFEYDNPNKVNKFFKGAIDELYVFEAALDQHQILSLMEKNRLPYF